MRKIMSSLFVIASLLGVGIFATGAYFTDTITQDNYTFTTGSADLKFGFCGPLGAFCDSSTATLDNITFSTAQTTGPGIEASNCIVVKNTGPYALGLSSQLFITDYSHIDMTTAFQVAANTANNNCVATSVLRPWASAASEASAGQVSLSINLAPGQECLFHPLQPVGQHRPSGSSRERSLEAQDGPRRPDRLAGPRQAGRDRPA